MRGDGIIPNRNELSDKAYREGQMAREYRTPTWPHPWGDFLDPADELLMREFNRGRANLEPTPLLDRDPSGASGHDAR